VGLNWTINFVNKAVLNLVEKHGVSLSTYEIQFIETNIKKTYLGSPEMWLVTTEEYRMPMIFSDLLYCLKEELRSVIESDFVVNKETVKFANNVKKLIYEKSNNIALLTIIADIGMEFRQKLPGFAFDLATNIDIIQNDLTRLSLLVKDPYKEMLEKQILMAMGMPFSLPDRYNKKDAEQYDLLTYISDSQIYYGDEIKTRCHTILDYLYSIVPNSKSMQLSICKFKRWIYEPRSS
jgi:hypothetical protein